MVNKPWLVTMVNKPWFINHGLLTMVADQASTRPLGRVEAWVY